MTGDAWFEAGYKHRFFSFHLDPTLRPSLADFSFLDSTSCCVIRPSRPNPALMALQWRFITTMGVFPPPPGGSRKHLFHTWTSSPTFEFFSCRIHLSAPVSHTVVLLSSQVLVFFLQINFFKMFWSILLILCCCWFFPVLMIVCPYIAQNPEPDQTQANGLVWSGLSPPLLNGPVCLFDPWKIGHL